MRLITTRHPLRYNRALRRRTSITLLTAALSGCTTKSRQPKVTLGIAAQQSISQVPAYLAAQLGLYAKHGVEVELVDFPGASKGMEALLGGSVDVLSGYYSQLLQVREQNRPIQAFLAVYDSLLVALAIAPAAQAAITSIADLKGKKIGVTTLGSATHQFIDALLRRAGLAPTDITPIAIGTAARAAAAMERSMVDAGVVTDFTIRYLEKRFGAVKLLVDTRNREGTKAAHGTSKFPGTTLLAPQPSLDQHPQQAKALTRAIRAASLWMQNHSAEQIVDQMPPSHYGEDRPAYLEAIRNAIPMLSLDGIIAPEGHQAALQFLNLPDRPIAFARHFIDIP